MNKPRAKPVTAYAVATVTIEVHGLGSWGKDCNLLQVHRQASEEAIGIIRRMDARGQIRVVGQPEIKTIIAEERP
jgi:hypothetical protein